MVSHDKDDPISQIPQLSIKKPMFTLNSVEMLEIDHKTHFSATNEIIESHASLSSEQRLSKPDLDEKPIERIKKKSQSGYLFTPKIPLPESISPKHQLDPRILFNDQLLPTNLGGGSKQLPISYLNSPKKRASFQIPPSYEESPSNTNAIPAFPFHRVSIYNEAHSHNRGSKYHRPSQNRSPSKQHSFGTSGKLMNTLVGIKKKTFYDVISNFYMTKKFMSILRGLTSTRTPKWLNNYHFETINDISFFHTVYREQEYNNLINEEKSKKDKLFNEKFKLYSTLKTYFLKKKGGRQLLDLYEKYSEKFDKIFQVFDPSKSFIICWESLILLCILLYFIVIPIEISFAVSFFDLVENLYILNEFGFYILLFDILKKFNTAFYLKGVLVMKRKGIATHYLKKNFWWDLLSVGSLFFKQVLCTHFEIFSYDDWRVKLICLLFFFKFFEFETIIKKFEDLIFFDKSLNNKLALFKLILKILLVSHIFACLWHIVGYQSMQYATTSWIIRGNLVQSVWYIRYIYSYYYVCVTMNTVGYGDITPTNIYEVLFVILLIYIACAIFAYSLNSIGIIISNIMKQEDEFKNDLNTINDFMQEKNINFDLRMRVRKYLEYIWHEEKIDKVENQAKIIEKLSDSLKDELLLEANGTIIRDIKMFSLNFSEDTLRQTVSIMKEMRYTPGDLIFLKDETENKALYIIRKGEVEIFLETPKSVNPVTVLKKLKEGDVFGELAFFSDNARTACARSTDFTTVFMIKQEDFLNVIRKYNKDFEKYCEIRDNINHYNDYSDIFLKCFSCNEPTHPVKYCNLLHYTALREIIVRRHAYTSFQNRKKEVRRRKKKDSNALSMLENIENGAYVIQKEIFPPHETDSSSNSNTEDEEEEDTNNTIEEEDNESTENMASEKQFKSFKRGSTGKESVAKSRFSNFKKNSLEGGNNEEKNQSMEIKESTESSNEDEGDEASEMFNKNLNNNGDANRKNFGRRKSRKKNILVRKSLARINSKKSVGFDVNEIDDFLKILQENDHKAEYKEFRSLKSEFAEGGPSKSLKSIQSPAITNNSNANKNTAISGFLKILRRLFEMSKTAGRGTVSTNNINNNNINKNTQPAMDYLGENGVDLDRIKSFDFYFSYNNIENVISQMEMLNLMKLRRKTGKTQNKLKHLYLQNSLKQKEGVPNYIRGSVLVNNNKNDNNIIDDFLYNKNQELLQKRQYNAHTFIRKNFFKNAPMIEKMLQEERFDPEKIKEFYINKYMRGKTQTIFFRKLKIFWNCFKKIFKGGCFKRKKQLVIIEKNEKNDEKKKTTISLKRNNESVENSMIKTQKSAKTPKSQRTKK